MACRPKCDPANEAVSSELNNFVLNFFGSVTKSCVNGQVVWTLPCNLAEGMPCYPRLPNEGLACYILRLFDLFGLVASGAWDVNVTYCKNAFVTYGGQGYVAIAATTTGEQPDISPASWTLYIQKGADGVNIPSPLTTKGDIWGYDTANNRIPVGADNEALIADSTQALGVRWGLPPSSDTASNLGAGDGVFSSKAGNDFQFKSLIAGSNITITPTGTDLTIASSGGGGGFTESFVSAPQIITSAGLLTLAHGLSLTPTLFAVVLKCVNNNSQWIAGDEVIYSTASEGIGHGQAIYCDATNIYVRFGSAAVVYEHLEKVSGNDGSFTNVDWNVIFKAWA